MYRNIRIRTALVLVVAIAPAVACRHKDNEQNAAGDVAPPPSLQPATTPDTSFRPSSVRVDSVQPKPKHHSKAAGAAIGAAAGHMIGHGTAGAAAGAIIQHERNKHEKHKK